jgi:hypothetical protein
MYAFDTEADGAVYSSSVGAFDVEQVCAADGEALSLHPHAMLGVQAAACYELGREACYKIAGFFRRAVQERIKQAPDE